MPSLPPELISRFISFLSKEPDTKTLINLSYAATCFVEPCQAVLFSHITLIAQTKRPDYLPGEWLLDLFATAPAVARHIKWLTISDASKTFWLSKDDKLAEALSRVYPEKIKRLEIRLSSNNSWPGILPAAQTAIQKILQSPSLGYLTLYDAPLQLLSQCSPGLKHLSARGSLMERLDLFQPIHRNSPIHPQILLLINNPDSAIDYLLDDANQIKVDTLAGVEISGQKGAQGQTSKLLDSCRSSLKIFIFTVPDALPKGTKPDFDIGQCKLLGIVELVIRVTHRDAISGTSESRLQWATALLASIPPSNVITQLHLTLGIDLWHDTELRDRCANAISTQLHDLAQVLFGGQYFAHLEEVNVNLNPAYSPTTYERAKDYVQTAMTISPMPCLLTINSVPYE